MSKRFIRATGSLDLILTWFPPLRITDNTIEDLGLPSWCCPFTYFDSVDLWDIGNMGECELRERQIETDPLWRFCSSKGVEHHWLQQATSKAVRWAGQVLQVLGPRLGQIMSPSAWTHQQSGLRELEIFDAISRLLAIHSPLYSEASRLRKSMIRLFETTLAHENMNPQYKEPPDPNGTPILRLASLSFYSIDIETTSREGGVVGVDKGLILGEPLRIAKENDLDRAASDRDSEELRLAARAVQEVLSSFNPTCFLIDSEFVGLAPGDVQEGEEVWLLTGCSIPGLLKRGAPDRDSALPRYTVRSQALVDMVTIRGKRCHVMDGEAWKSAESEDLEWVSII